MSLISEGLRKAHLETLRQDRENRRQYFNPGRSDVPSRGSRRGVLFTAAVGGAILAAAATAAWFTGNRAASEAALQGVPSENATVSREASTEGTIVPEIGTRPVTVTAGTIVDSPRADRHVTVGDEIESQPSALEARTIASAVIPVARTTPTGAAVPTVSKSPAVADAPFPRGESPARSGAKRREGLEDGESYASPVRAPGGGEVRLSGVSSSKGRSLAIINGTVVREGETVGPFVVEAIERDRVKLRYVDVRFWLSY